MTEATGAGSTPTGQPFSVSSNGTVTGMPSGTFSPGMPNSTVIETSTQTPPADTPAPTYDTRGDPTARPLGVSHGDVAKDAAQRFVDANAKAYMTAAGDSRLAKDMKAALAFIHQGGNRPSFIGTQQGETPVTGHAAPETTMANGQKDVAWAMTNTLSKGIDAGLVSAPAELRDAEYAVGLAVLQGCPRPVAEYVSGLLHATALGGDELKSALSVAAHHIRTEADPSKGFKALTAEDHAIYQSVAIEAYGSQEKYNNAVNGTLAYFNHIDSTLVDTLRKSAIGQSSLMYSPQILNLYHARAVALGLVKS